MKVASKLRPLVVATSVAFSAMAPSFASADTSASVAASNMYLWRGQNLTPNGAAVSGSLDYSNDSGVYAGIWASTETGGHETDLYVGWGGEFAGVGVDVSYWKYLYPEDVAASGDGLSDTDWSEVAVGLSYGPVSFNAFLQAETDNGAGDFGDNNYFTLGYGQGKFNALYGFWSKDSGVGEYSHVQVGYAATDALSFAVSKVIDADDSGVEEDPLFQVTYALSFDL